MTYTELETFYLDLVSRAQSNGITCAITSGMACVYYGVAQTTKDCDLLCDSEAADIFLDLIENTQLKGVSPVYRGNLSPPMDKRWLIGGWTSHFYWPSPDEDGAYLDVFGIPPRASSPWQNEIEGFYSGRHTVAEMKRTDRDKDWPFATALGEQMLEAGDPKGWLHIYDAKCLLKAFQDIASCPSEMTAQRPTLSLLPKGETDELELAIRAEREFWHQLDKARIGMMRANLRPYVLAVKKESKGRELRLMAQHKIRVEIAGELLPFDPMEGFAPVEAAEQARERATKFLPEAAIEWLPDIEAYSSLFLK